MGYYYPMENPNLAGIMNTLLGLPLQNGQVKVFSGKSVPSRKYNDNKSPSTLIFP